MAWRFDNKDAQELMESVSMVGIFSKEFQNFLGGRVHTIMYYNYRAVEDKDSEYAGKAGALYEETCNDLKKLNILSEHYYEFIQSKLAKVTIEFDTEKLS
jgi:hypothetical protein